MKFASFDIRGYPTVTVQDGYREWADSYEATVLDLMDLRLLDRLRAVPWARAGHALDLACGTGRCGVWLRARGVASLDGLDLSEPMLTKAWDKGAYDRLFLAAVTDTRRSTGRYGVAVMSLADEHLAALGPLYDEAARVLAPDGRFVLVGYHPHFLMLGVVTHFDRPSGDPVAIESHVHLMSDHVAAAHGAGFRLEEMVEGTVDDAWLAAKPKWRRYRDHPVSFAYVWRKAESIIHQVGTEPAIR
ncbi:class I SAM-dependent DNA methyltransferase [Marinivivus vitaminiproducens]|uniref:class I SAM-dependent DNA methyltransferase n=1 Tax=Marinivivus vitaminiproducens TaxID=3035935 RepID=UPI0027984ED4|nr:methyltransferase domain-containing protein [Geminicoccaceae bacterium SCSIO 64248]